MKEKGMDFAKNLPKVGDVVEVRCNPFMIEARVMVRVKEIEGASIYLDVPEYAGDILPRILYFDGREWFVTAPAKRRFESGRLFVTVVSESREEDV